MRWIGALVVVIMMAVGCGGSDGPADGGPSDGEAVEGPITRPAADLGPRRDSALDFRPSSGDGSNL